jgi:hypothetical protein
MSTIDDAVNRDADPWQTKSAANGSAKTCPWN